MKIIKITIVSIAVIIGLVLIASPALNLYNKCAVYFHKKAFLAKYEFEDFSQFKDVDVFKRGGDKNQQILAMFISYHINDNSKTGCYLVTLDKKNCHILKTKWTTEHHIEADTLKLQQLAQTFMKYKIPRLNVDTAGNVFVYLKDIETLAFVKFANESELRKRSKETEWVKINDKNTWYRHK